MRKINKSTWDNLPHKEKYEYIIDSLGGIEKLKYLMPDYDLNKCLQEDKNLNNIPLKIWEKRHDSIQFAIRRIRPFSDFPFEWSIIHSVYTLKEAVKMIILKESK